MREAFCFSQRTRTWSLSLPGAQAHGIKKASGWIEANGRKCRFNEADHVRVIRGPRLTAGFVFSRPGLLWTLDLRNAPGRASVMVHSCITNTSPRLVRLGRCAMLSIDATRGGRVQLGPRPEEQSFLSYTSGWFDHVRRITSGRRGKLTSGPICHIHNPATGATYCAGFVTFDRARASTELVWRNRQGIASQESYLDFNGFALEPGVSIETEKMLVQITDDPYAPLERWARTVQQIYKPPVPERSPAGWIGWSWVDGFSGEETAESIVARNSDAVCRRLHGLGVDYVWMSIVNLEGGLPGNWLKFNRELFPHGVEHTLARLKAKGFKPGFWTGLYMVCEGTEALRENRDNLLKNPDGSPARYGQWRWPWAYRNKAGEGGRLYRLDGSHPKTVAFLKHVFTQYRKLGIRYYMIDFLDAGMPQPEHKHSDASMVKGNEVYRHALLAVRRAAGPDTHLLSAVGSGVQNIGVVNASRIGLDYGEGRHVVPGFPSYPATYIANTAEVPDGVGPSHRNALQSLASAYFTHGRLWLNDSNLLTVDKPVPRNEALISVSLFGMSGSPVMLGDDIDTIDEERLALIRKILPRTRDTAFPVDLFTRIQPEDYSRVLAVPVKQPWGEWTVVGLFNLDEQPVTIPVTMESLRLPGNRAFHLYDFWDERYLGTVTSRFDVHVAPFSCRVLRLARRRAHPWILSSDMHVRQGQVELADVRWDPRKLTLSGTAIRPVGEEGNLFIISPLTYRPRAYAGLTVARDGTHDALIVRRPIRFSRNRMPWQIRFERA